MLEPDASTAQIHKKRLRNGAVAAGAIGLVALGAFLMHGLLGLGTGAGGSPDNSDSKSTSKDENTKRSSYNAVVTLRVVGERFEVRELAGTTATWEQVDLEQIKTMVAAAPGNDSGIRVRYYVSEMAVFDAVERLRQSLLQTVEAKEIYAIPDDAD